MNDLDDTTSLPPASEDVGQESNNFRSYLASRSYTTVTGPCPELRFADSPAQSRRPHGHPQRPSKSNSAERRRHLPVACMGRITSFGWRVTPLPGGSHTGIDIAAAIYGSPIYATATGTVAFAGYRSSYGYLVIIEHGYGFSTYYAHQSRIKVKAGQAVEAGTLVGYVGSSGVSTGPHLHYEVRRWGTPVNPVNYLP